MAGRGSPLSRNFSIGDSSETNLPHKPTPEEKGKGYRYPMDNEVVDDLRRITSPYAKNVGGLPIVSVLPRREYQKKDRPQLKDSVLVEYLEELVGTTLQEFDQPLDQLGPYSSHCSPS